MDISPDKKTIYTGASDGTVIRHFLILTQICCHAIDYSIYCLSALARAHSEAIIIELAYPSLSPTPMFHLISQSRSFSSFSA
jgi:hypothetical protein